MTVQNHGIHHFHKRKRIHQLFEKYPHPNTFKRFMDKGIYVVAIIGPLMTIPQITKIWVGQTAAGVSVISWATFCVTATFWMMYGILHKEKPIIFSNILWLILQSFIVVGAIIYG